MADDTLIEDFINQINEVKQEYKKDSLEYKIPTSFIATIATAETGNMEFEMHLLQKLLIITLVFIDLVKIKSI